MRKLWEAFKKKDKATLSSLIDDGFRQFEEGLTTFGDKKTEVNAVDEFDLLNYTLSDFTVKSTRTERGGGDLHCAVRGQIRRRESEG